MANLADKIERAVQARHLVDAGLFAESLAQLEAEYIAKWRASKDPAEREDLHRLVNLIDRFKADMRSVITTGDIAAKERAGMNV